MPAKLGPVTRSRVQARDGRAKAALSAGRKASRKSR